MSDSQNPNPLAQYGRYQNHQDPSVTKCISNDDDDATVRETLEILMVFTEILWSQHLIYYYLCKSSVATIL